MIHEVLPDRLMMFVNQAHNIYIKKIPVIKHKYYWKKITHSVSWFFRITLAKNQDSFVTFQQLCPISRLFQSWKKKSQISGLFQWESWLTLCQNDAGGITKIITMCIHKQMSSKRKGYQEMVFLVSQAQVADRLAVSAVFLSSPV